MAVDLKGAFLFDRHGGSGEFLAETQMKTALMSEVTLASRLFVLRRASAVNRSVAPLCHLLNVMGSESARSVPRLPSNNRSQRKEETPGLKSELVSRN